jgi:hypothetical protein
MTAITHTYRFTGRGEDFGPRSDGLVTFHTWESHPTDLSVASAMKGLVWQDGDDVLGSYNRVVCSDGIISTVPDNHASGGINPSSQDFKPKAWLFDKLSSEQVRNPNYFTLNVCARGQRAYFDTHGWPASIIDGMARCWIDEERRLGRKVVPTNHADFQTNRSDAGAIAMSLIKKRYAELMEDPMAWISDVRAVVPYIAIIEGTEADPANTRPAPDFDNTPYPVTAQAALTVVGEVTGAEFRGSTVWKVYQSANGGFRCFHASLQIGSRPIAVQQVDGYTAAELEAARVAALAVGRAEGIDAAADAVASLK